ncbi:MAG TPA: bacteriohopanetetrol glucosamine biosynthesis glycosyltransferase HpnI [Methylomirabilota bacterium]|nr:bacteriohopanetetrol glucosamine biosynthesis glycosyltransferase HpnI [Methylomirabilota bacterium]
MSQPYLSVARDAVLVLAAAPLLYYALSAAASVRFFRRERRRKLEEFMPPVSVLKPVRGVDAGSYENYLSFLHQDYPDYEIVFAARETNDPAASLVRRIIAEHPGRRVRLLVGSPRLGANGKVNKLCRLAKEARHEILVISDGDVRVGPRYLRRVVAPLADGKTGLVTCFYRAIAAPDIFAELEAVGAASDFFAGVLTADWLEGMRFALGASMTTTKLWVKKAGGFEAIVDAHSDDYELGNRIAKQGGRVVLSAEAVWTMYTAESAKEFWEHQVRWARTVRLCRPASYAGLIFTHGLPWAVLAALVAPSRGIAAGFVAAYLALRFAQAWAVGVWGVRDAVLRRKLWLVPIRDAVNFVVWLASFASNRISWAGEEFEIQGGAMVAAGEVAEAAAGRARE